MGSTPHRQMTIIIIVFSLNLIVSSFILPPLSQQIGLQIITQFSCGSAFAMEKRSQKLSTPGSPEGTVQEVPASPSAGKKPVSINKMKKCTSTEFNLEFLCDSGWKVEGKKKDQHFVLSQDPKITLRLHTVDENIKLLGQATRSYVSQHFSYEEGFQMGWTEFAGHNTLELKAISREKPNQRHLNYLFIHNHHLSAITFVVDPKERFSEAQNIIQIVRESFKTIKESTQTNAKEKSKDVQAEKGPQPQETDEQKMIEEQKVLPEVMKEEAPKVDQEIQNVKQEVQDIKDEGEVKDVEGEENLNQEPGTSKIFKALQRRLQE